MQIHGAGAFEVSTTRWARGQEQIYLHVYLPCEATTWQRATKLSMANHQADLHPCRRFSGCLEHARSELRACMAGNRMFV
jgi:hypothetical protein